MHVKDDNQESEEMLILPKYDPQDDMFLSLIHVALKIRGYMMATRTT